MNNHDIEIKALATAPIEKTRISWFESRRVKPKKSLESGTVKTAAAIAAIATKIASRAFVNGALWSARTQMLVMDKSAMVAV